MFSNQPALSIHNTQYYPYPLSSDDSPSPSFALDGELMDADTDYVISVNVTIFLGGSDVASLTVHRRLRSWHKEWISKFLTGGMMQNEVVKDKSPLCCVVLPDVSGNLSFS